MTRTAFFLGAGCSANFGYPVTSQILPIALERASRKKLFTEVNSNSHERKDETFLRNELSKLFPGLSGGPRNAFDASKVAVDVTDVLSLIDFGLENGHHFVANGKLDDLRYLRKLVERAVVEVLWDGTLLPGEVKALSLFNEWIKRLKDSRHLPTTFVTTNYDYVVEDVLFGQNSGNKRFLGDDEWPDEKKISQKVDFGFNWRSPFEESQMFLRPTAPEWAIYKLHGSITWLRCPMCSHLYQNVAGHIAFNAYQKKIDDDNTCECRHAPLEAHIVAPSLVRDIRDSNLLDIWKNAQEMLRLADVWYMIGYSFPAEDIAIRSMLMRAYQLRKKKPKVVVIQQSESSKPRYEMFFGKVEFHTGGLLEYLKKVLPRAQ